MEKKKLLVFANYFYPEVASTAQILTELCGGLKKDYVITVICSVPCYTGKIEEKYKKEKFYYEAYNGVNILRVRVKEFSKTSKKSRIFHILSYFFHSIGATFKVGKQDVVFAISQPPVLGGILGNIGRMITKGKFIYNIQDFNPEQIMAVNYSKNKWLLKFMLLFDQHTCKKASLVITVGRDMQKTLEHRFKNKKIPNNRVINNWTNESDIYPLNKDHKKVMEFKKKNNLENKFIIMYSGNLGLYYDLENLIHLFLNFKNEKEVVFALVGEGALKKKLEEIVRENHADNITFIPYQDKKDLIYSLNSADVHLVTNAKGIKGVSVPSKIYGCMATNVPILGILERGTEASQIINDSKCGVVCETGHYEEIEKKLKMILKEKDSFIKKHLTGRKYLEEHFTKDKSIKKYSEAIESVLNGDRK